MTIVDDATRRAAQAQAEKWRSDFEKLASRFPPEERERALSPTTDAGLPIRPCYFPHDLDALDASALAAAPGAYPFTRGNLPSFYQLMSWANQPVIGYGLPEDTRARMDA